MIERHTFVETLDIITMYTSKMTELEKIFNTYFDNNWMTQVIDRLLQMLSKAFFTPEQLEKIDDKVVDLQLETIEQLIYHFCFNGDFGANTKCLKDVYVRDGMDPKHAYNTDDIYDIILDYLINTDDDVTFNLAI